jgi:hypothetical protein
VKAAEAKSDKEILLTLEAPAPEKIGEQDVTGTPSVIVRRCQVSVDSCRGDKDSIELEHALQNSNRFP